MLEEFDRGRIVFGPAGQSIEWGTAAPTGTGTSYAAGSIVLKSNAGGNGPCGWICVTAGAPGTWSSFGGFNVNAMITATATLDFPSIAAGATAELTMSVNFATVGDVVSANPSTTLESGLIWCAYISASNTVTIRIHNTTAGAIDPASRTWRATIIK